MDFKKTNTSQNILLCCSGSVATIKLPKIIDKLETTNKKLDVRVVCTERSRHFCDVSALPIPVYTDDDEWSTWTKIGDPVLHIELRRWADILVIAPLDANTMAKVAGGLCDNLLTCVARAWDMSKPFLFAPAMNTYMWDHPLTTQHITKLKELGYTEIPCVRKVLACGDEGLGAMAEVDTIVTAIMAALPTQSPVSNT